MLKCGLILLLIAPILWGATGLGEQEKVVCPSPLPPTPDITRRDVYKNMPFREGEVQTFEVSYMGVKVGYADLEVSAPYKVNGVWNRQFHGHGKTGDWYKVFFSADDKVQAYSRPWDFGVTRFYMEQDEGRLLTNRFVQKKWLEFNQDHCTVHEKTAKMGKSVGEEDHDLAYGAIDALSAVYKLRTFEFKVGQTERFLVYTSEKNWWLEAEPIEKEKLTLESGTFDTMKLRLKTYLGKDLQQRGDVYAWIDQSTPNRPVVQIKGEIKIGSVLMELVKFTPGR